MEGIGGEPGADGGVVVAIAEEVELGFGVEPFGGEAPGAEEGAGVLAEGSIGEALEGSAGGVDEVGDVAAEVVEGEVEDALEFDSDGSADFGTFAIQGLASGSYSLTSGRRSVFELEGPRRSPGDQWLQPSVSLPVRNQPW